jgi:ADP-heptose:LPS heptosyltransferase
MPQMRIVVLRALGIGDLLTAVPALHALQAAYPDAGIAVAAPRTLAPVVRLAGCELIDAAALQPLSRPAHGADLLVNLHGRGPQSHAVALAARPRRLVAFAHPAIPETAGMPAHRDDEHEAVRWCRLLSESGIPADPRDVDLAAPPLPPEHRQARGATVIHPGAGTAERRWPARRFAVIARTEVAAGRRIVITGAPSERALALEVARRAGLPPAVVLAGRTGLHELAALVGHAGRVVCGDTGVGHLATALGIPSVVLFGPTSPAQWGPPPDRREHHRVVWAGRGGYPRSPTPHQSLLDLDPDRVLAELAALPSRPRIPASPS